MRAATGERLLQLSCLNELNRMLLIMVKKIMLIVVSVTVLASLSGCNTVHGFGEDIQHLGGAISRAG
jgi:predicted small secreted protein